jgi:hypothetical protein
MHEKKETVKMKVKEGDMKKMVKKGKK